MGWARRALPDSALGRARLAVIALSGVATFLKLQVAARTFGTNDVGYWGVFAQAVRHFGPVGIYGHHLTVPVVYNHGPLAGWMILAINWVLDHHVLKYDGRPFSRNEIVEGVRSALSEQKKEVMVSHA